MKSINKEVLCNFYRAFSDPDNYPAEKVAEDFFARDFTMITNGKRLDWSQFREHMKFIRAQMNLAISIEHFILKNEYIYDMHSAFGFNKKREPIHLRYIAKTFFNTEHEKISKIESMSFPIYGDMSHIDISTNFI
ncbi:hypothetical protein [Cysteiniphilum halobium]|uniref:hypothetical protein n=1 Tax=Cysteiniphilum halobium TaxID=2219059 RepID=UPI000E658404|nr:hypothetical protein [Cysteiniphilum halobium]